MGKLLAVEVFTRRKFKYLLSLILMLPLAAFAHLISITPTTPFPASVSVSSTTTASFTITNTTSHAILSVIDESQFPSGLAISSSTCSAALSPGQSCLINLTLNAPSTAQTLTANLRERASPSADGVAYPFTVAVKASTSSTGAFAVSPNTNNIYSFNPASTSTPATVLISGLNAPDNIVVSPDGQTVYFTQYVPYGSGGDVYSFPTAGPYIPTPLATGISYPAGIAISSDGTTGYVASNASTSAGIYSFPLGGLNHTATKLTANTTVITRPLLIAIKGSTAYVADRLNSLVYSMPVNSSSYTATQIQTFPGSQVTGLAVSNNGYLYIGIYQSNMIYQVPLATPTIPPTQVAAGVPQGYTDGLGVSNDGNTVFISVYSYGIYSFPTNVGGFPQTPTYLSGLGLNSAWALAITP